MGLIFVRPLYRIRYIGREHIPKGAFVLASNHVSYFDPLCLGFGFRRTLHFMAKSELFTDYGIFVRVFFRLCSVFPVKRSTADTASVNKAASLLKKGCAVAIFPQGGIVNDNCFTPKSGAALLSARCKVPLLPVSIYSKGKIRPFTRITVRIGEPLWAEDESLRKAKHLNMKLQAKIQSFLEEGHEH